jgi:hypothetical protein
VNLAFVLAVGFVRVLEAPVIGCFKMFCFWAVIKIEKFGL